MRYAKDRMWSGVDSSVKIKNIIINF